MLSFAFYKNKDVNLASFRPCFFVFALYNIGKIAPYFVAYGAKSPKTYENPAIPNRERS